MKNAIAIAIQTGVPVILWGSPGTGKTSFLRSIGEKLGLPVEVVIASIREPSDFAGLPIVRDGGVELAPPSWALRLAKAGKGLLFLDEISTAPPAVQAALLRVVLDRTVGDLSLPEGVAVIAAANPPEQAAGGWDLTPPLANRFVHLRWEVDAVEWATGMIQGWPAPDIPVLPEGWERNIPAARALVAAFIRRRPHLLSALPASDSEAGKAWPSPRSWDMAARLIAAADAVGDRQTKAMLIAGTVGEGAGLEFLAWESNLDLPDPEEVLANPAGFPLPVDRGDKLFAVLMSVASAVTTKLTKSRWEAAWTVTVRAAEAGGPAVAYPAVQVLCKHVESSKSGVLPPSTAVRVFGPILGQIKMVVNV